MEWDGVHLISMDTVNAVKFSFFFSFLPSSSSPLKKPNSPISISFIGQTFIYSFIHLFIYLLKHQNASD